jgi:hypothetical protein
MAERNVRAVVLVEGVSDERALDVAARRHGRDLVAEGVAIVAMGGAKNVGRYLHHYGPPGLDLPLAGLYDAGEEEDFRRGLQRAGVGTAPTRSAMAELGFHVCDVDLEDELIRALGVAAVEAVIEAQGDLASLRIFQRQPAQQGRSAQQQLRRFMGTRSGRKAAYAGWLVEALELTSLPAPLQDVLAQV